MAGVGATGIVLASVFGGGGASSDKGNDVEKANSQTPDVENVAPRAKEELVVKGSNLPKSIDRESAVQFISAISAASMEVGGDEIIPATGPRVVVPDKVEGYNYSGDKLTVATSSFAEQDLRNSNFSNSDVRGVDFTEAKLENSNLKNIILVGVNMSSVEGHNISAPGATIARSDFTDADLSFADLTNSNIEHATFTGANLENSNFIRSTITNSDLSGIDDLSSVNFKAAAIDFETISSNPEAITSSYIDGNLELIGALDRGGEGIGEIEYRKMEYTINQMREAGVDSHQLNIFEKRVNASFEKSMTTTLDEPIVFTR